jgi:hypothetical protein
VAKIIVGGIIDMKCVPAELSRRFSSTRKENGDKSKTISSMLHDICMLMMKGHGKKKEGAVLVDALWDESFLHGESRTAMIAKVHLHLRQHVFAPYKIMKAIDLAGFKLSLEGLEVVRQLEAKDVYERCMIPSKATILRVARRVEAAAEKYCPFKMIDRAYEDIDRDNEYEGPAFGEGFEFEVAMTMRTLLTSYGVMDVAKARPLELSVTSDAANITKDLTHYTLGVKNVDTAL